MKRQAATGHAARRSRRFWLTLTLFAVLALAVLYVVLSGLDDFDLSGYETAEIRFDFSGSTVAGALHLPPSDAPPLVLLVHGDGPQDRYSGGAYLPLIRTLLDKGIAVFSWDKPGIGSSSGQWLDQSLEDRSALAAAVLDHLRTRSDFKASAIGFLGFSQAGWVLPYLAQANGQADFFVLVGGAINWQRQGDYFTRKRLASDGLEPEGIEAYVQAQTIRNQTLPDPQFTYNMYLRGAPSKTAMSEKRFNFVRRNMLADSTNALRMASKPFLVLHGSDDLNVDPNFNSKTYKTLLAPNNTANRFRIIEGASHALLRANLFNHQLPDRTPFWVEYAFLGLGRNAYAPGALDTLASWIKGRVPETQTGRR